MRKKLQVVIFSTILILCGCLIFDAESQSAVMSKGTLRWIREQSFCKNITIQNDQAILTYSFHFENTTDKDLWVCYPQAKFTRFKLRGWLEYGHFSGYGENGENMFLVPANDKADIIVIFMGNYLGGSVNNELTLPSIVFVQKDSPG